MPVKAIFSAQQDVGKNIKSSKKRYTWKFQIDGTDYTIELFVSSLSGKKKVTLNGSTKHEGTQYGSFQWSTVLKNNQCMIFEQNDFYDLRINNQSFSHLYLIEKTKKNFEFEDGYKEDKVNQVSSSSNNPPSRSSMNKPKEKQREEDYDSFGFDHGFDKFAPTNDSKAYSPEKPEADGFSTFQNQFSKPLVQNAPPKPTQPPVQQRVPVQPKSQFNDFANFGQPAPAQQKAPGNDPFSNFSGFQFDEPKPAQQQQSKPNPFGDFSQPAPQQQQQQFIRQPSPPKPQPPKVDNLLDFMDDPVPPPQQQQQVYQPPAPVQQQKQIPQELLDIFDDPVPPPQQSQIISSSPPFVPPTQQYVPQPVQQQPFIPSASPFVQQQYAPPPQAKVPVQSAFPPYGVPAQQQNPFAPQQQPLYGAPTYQQPQPTSGPAFNLYQPQPQSQVVAPKGQLDILAAYQVKTFSYMQQPAPPQPVQKSTPFDDLF